MEGILFKYSKATVREPQIIILIIGIGTIDNRCRGTPNPPSVYAPSVDLVGGDRYVSMGAVVQGGEGI